MFLMIKLAFTQFLRDVKSGELKILMSALIITVLTSTAINYFGTRLQLSMEENASELLAADALISSTSEIDNKFHQMAKDNQLKTAEVITFSSVVLGESNLQLVSVKAVSDAYPLRGQLKIKDHENSEEITTEDIPKEGEIWVEPRLLAILDVGLNDTLEIGNSTFTITKILTYEPDRAGGFYGLNPHVLINLKDLAKTESIQPGSRVMYRLLVAGENERIQTFAQNVKPQLAANQKYETPKESGEQINSALTKAETYLNLTSLVGIMIAGVAIALSANQFAQNRFDTSAIYRSIGVSQKKVLGIFTIELLFAGLVSGVIGAILGFCAQFGLFWLLDSVIQKAVPQGGFKPALMGILIGLIILLGFALPPLMSLSKIPPIRVLRSTVSPKPIADSLKYGLVVLVLFVLMWQLNLELILMLSLIAGMLGMLAVLSILLYLFIQLIRVFVKKMPFSWRLGLGQILKNPVKSMGQIMAFSIILMAMALIVLLRGELIDSWKSQLPENAPNYFALNITKDELPSFKSKIDGLTKDHAPYYPIIGGRLTEVKGESIEDLVLKERGENATRRDLNLTWTYDLPDGNEITKGRWWNDETTFDADENLVHISIEDKLAMSLGVDLGDRLTFVISGKTFEAQIESIRSVNWENLQPNFFVIFHPKAFSETQTTYLTSFYIENNRAILELSKDYPTVTVLDINGLLSQLSAIFTQITLAVEYVLLMVLLAGLIVLIAGLQSTLKERLKEGAILRSLGAQYQLIKKSTLIEFGLLGALSGFLAIFGCELISFILYHYVLDFAWHFHFWLFVLPIIGALIIITIGYLSTKKVLTKSPLSVLREF